MQLLIAIRLFTLLCDQSPSQARLITIMKLIAKVGIIYATACHASLCSTALDCPSVRCHCRRTALTTIYKHGTGRGRWELARQVQQQLALWVCLKWVHAATVHPHWCHIASTVAYLGSLTKVAPLIAITDRDQLLVTSRSSIILLSDRGKP